MQPGKSPGAEPLAEWRGVRLLVVDESPSDGEALVRCLVAWGLRAEHVASSGTALSALREGARRGDPYRAAMLAQPATGAGAETLGAAIRAEAGLQGTGLIMLTSVSDLSKLYTCLTSVLGGATPPAPLRPEAPGSSAEPDKPARAVFDEAEFMDRMLEDAELAETIISAFLDDIPRQLEALKTHLQANDVASATRQAHSIKGAASNVSAESLRALAWEMEQAGKAGDLGAISAQLTELEERFAQLTETLEPWRAQIRSRREAA